MGAGPKPKIERERDVGLLSKEIKDRKRMERTKIEEPKQWFL